MSIAAKPEWDMTSQDDRALAVLPAAAALVIAVKEHDPATSHEVLNTATREELQALAVVLAAMVPEDRGVASLLDQATPQQRMIASPEAWTDEDLAYAHRTHNRLKANRLELPGWVVLGEREFQRRRHLRRKHMREVNARALAARTAGPVAVAS